MFRANKHKGTKNKTGSLHKIEKKLSTPSQKGEYNFTNTFFGWLTRLIFNFLSRKKNKINWFKERCTKVTNYRKYNLYIHIDKKLGKRQKISKK